MLKEGDTITVGCSPTIKVGESFLFFKPHASISRKLSDDVEGDLAEVHVELRKRLFAALRVEIESVNDVYAVLGDNDDLEALIALCEKEAGDVEGQSSFEVSQGEEGGQEAEAPQVEIDGGGNVVKKGPGKGVKLTKGKGGVKKKTPQG